MRANASEYHQTVERIGSILVKKTNHIEYYSIR
jgi:hypothetical protein